MFRHVLETKPGSPKHVNALGDYGEKAKGSLILEWSSETSYSQYYRSSLLFIRGTFTYGCITSALGEYPVQFVELFKS